MIWELQFFSLKLSINFALLLKCFNNSNWRPAKFIFKIIGYQLIIPHRMIYKILIYHLNFLFLILELKDEKKNDLFLDLSPISFIKIKFLSFNLLDLIFLKLLMKYNLMMQNDNFFLNKFLLSQVCIFAES